MIVKLLTEHHFEFLSLKGGCSGCFESIHIYSCQIPHCWKSHALAHLFCSIPFVMRWFLYELMLYIQFYAQKCCFCGPINLDCLTIFFICRNGKTSLKK